MQRFHIILFSVFAVLSVVFGFIQIGKNVTLSFNVPDELLSEEATNTVTQQFTDTDQDGLSDIEEIQVYYTSPYIADSDSDGVSDADEVALGTNPNCPEGTDCSGDGIVQSTEVDEVSTGEIDPETLETLEVLSTIQGGGIPDPEKVRNVLRSSGVSDEELAGASDEELLELMLVVMEQVQAQLQQPAE